MLYHNVHAIYTVQWRLAQVCASHVLLLAYIRVIELTQII